MDYQKSMQVKGLLKEAYLVRPRNLVFTLGAENEQVNALAADHRAVVGVGTIKRAEDDYAIRLYTQMPEPMFNRNELADQVGVAVEDLEIVITEGFEAFNTPIQTQVQPATPGCSVSPAQQGGTGTLGGFVKDSDNRVYMLSNNHVLANANRVGIGDAIIQPGTLDLTQAPNAIAKLSRFVPINFLGQNFVDAAIALLDAPDGHVNTVPNSVPQVGAIQGVGTPHTGMLVGKYGRTTGFTTGIIQSLAFDVTVNIAGSTANFDDQLLIEGTAGNFSNRGDSGSLIVDMDSKKVVGLLFAGDPSHGQTFANPITNVLRLLDVTLV